MVGNLDALQCNITQPRRARVDDVGIFAVAKRLVSPSEAEGFDERFEVRLAEEGLVVVALAAA